MFLQAIELWAVKAAYSDIFHIPIIFSTLIFFSHPTPVAYIRDRWTLPRQ